MPTYIYAIGRYNGDCFFVRYKFGLQKQCAILYGTRAGNTISHRIREKSKKWNIATFNRYCRNAGPEDTVDLNNKYHPGCKHNKTIIVLRLHWKYSRRAGQQHSNSSRNGMPCGLFPNSNSNLPLTVRSVSQVITSFQIFWLKFYKHLKTFQLFAPRRSSPCFD